MKERDSSKAAPDIRCATIEEGCNNAQAAWKVILKLMYF